MLLGVLLPTAGSITILGEDMLRHRYRVLPRMNFTSPYVAAQATDESRENLRVFAGVLQEAWQGVTIAAGAEVRPVADRRPALSGNLSAGSAGACCGEGVAPGFAIGVVLDAGIATLLPRGTATR